MPQKKETTRTTEKKSGGKVQDLAPKKDAKGGFTPLLSQENSKPASSPSSRAPSPEFTPLL